MRYSYSALKAFLTCPRQFEAKYITRTWPQEHDTPALRNGRQVHEHLERAVRGECEVRPGLWLPEGLMDLLRAAGAEAEVKLETADPHLIGYTDVLLQTDDQCLILDWKTGKLRPDPLQPDVYAMLVRRERNADRVQFGWIGVEAGAKVTCEPDDHAERRVLRIIEDIEASSDYPPVESWACRWCPLTWCKHNRS